MTSLNLKELVLDAFSKTVEQLKEGNPRAFELLRSTLSSVVSISDDEVLIYLHAMVGTLNTEFIENQILLDGGKKFLKELADNLERISKAFDDNNQEKLDVEYKKTILLMHKRWKVAKSLKVVED